MTRRAPFHKSLAENRREVAKALDHWSAMSGKPTPEGLRPTVTAKRMYTKHKAEGLSELQHGIRLVSTWDKELCHQYGLPPYALVHIPNGGGRGLNEAANLKRSGVRPGFEDYMLTVPRNGFHGLLIELKLAGGRISDEQHEMAKFHFGMGYQSHIAYSHEQAVEIIVDYLTPAI